MSFFFGLCVVVAVIHIAYGFWLVRHSASKAYDTGYALGMKHGRDDERLLIKMEEWRDLASKETAP